METFNKLATDDLYELMKIINISMNSRLKDWFLDNLTLSDSERLSSYSPFKRDDSEIPIIIGSKEELEKIIDDL